MHTEDELNLADAAAMERHSTIDARAAHALLAKKIWGALRGLGVERGRMVIVGDHAAVHAGLTEKTARPASMSSMSERWVAAIPPADEQGQFWWPHDNLRLNPLSEHDPATHDVVIASLPWSDLHFRSEHGRARSVEAANEAIGWAIDRTFPGGILAAVAPRQVLDQPDPAYRELFLDSADLLGAARLPGRFFRPDLTDGDTEACDLLFWRRRLPGEPERSPDFLGLEPVAVPGGVEYVNAYYGFEYPEHIVGTAGVVGDDDRNTARYTVRCDDEPVDVVLHHVVSRIAAQSRCAGLTAVSASWHPPETRLAPQADWPARRPVPPPPFLSGPDASPSL